MSILRAFAHIAAIAALAAFAFALGRWLRDPAFGSDLVVLLIVAAAVAWCLNRLYRPGGIASFSTRPPRERAAARERAPRPPSHAPATGMPFADEPGAEPPRRLWSR